jgi:hypothetical protein
MKPQELVADLHALGPGQSSRETLLYTRLLLRYLADHVHRAELQNGMQLRDATDFVAWLREVADEAASAAPAITETMCSADIGKRSLVSFRAPQPRWEDSCPRCGHVHQGDAECGEPIGGGRICRCEFEAVPA